MSKKLLEKNFCVIPWTGFELEPNGVVKNCIISHDKIGNIHNSSIETIIKNNPLRKQMLNGEYPSNCSGCYLQEKHRKNDFASISSRLYYAKEIGTKITKNLLDNADNFDLKHVDLRWTNSCNQACVYCGPEYSSKWAQELNEPVKSNKQARQKVKDFVFENVEQLQNIYLAGGEPMLMKENQEFLTLLKNKNPNCNIRVNTNLSTTKTGVFESLCSFKNVHWTISVESIEQEYEYIRHHGNWNDFIENLNIIKKLDHKISFNMLYFVLNYKSIFSTIEYFQKLNFHNNSFVIGPLYRPPWLNVLNLPNHILEVCKTNLKNQINKKPGFLLQNSWENILSYLTETKFYANIELTKQEIEKVNLRRNIDSKKIFPDLYREVLN